MFNPFFCVLPRSNRIAFAFSSHASTRMEALRGYHATSFSFQNRLEDLRTRLRMEDASKASIRTSSVRSDILLLSNKTTTTTHHNSTNGTNVTPPSLTDLHGRRHKYLRISLTERCNLRCTYCMPAEGIPDLTPDPSLLTTPEILHLASLFVTRFGVNKIRLTGGEPTLRKDLVDIVRELRSLPGLNTLAMTTNGVTLERLLPSLLDAGLTHLNISLDTLVPSKFESISRRPQATWHKVMSAIHASMDALQSPGKNVTQQDIAEKEDLAAVGGGGGESGKRINLGRKSSSSSSIPPLHSPLKLNTVVTRGVNEDELCSFVELTMKYPIHVRFIELMPFSGNGYLPSATVGWKEMVSIIQRDKFPDFAPVGRVVKGRGGGGGGEDEEAVASLVKSGEEESSTSTTAKLWHVPGAVGRVGFISTMTDAFCGSCDRLRLTADGHIKACLHGQEEYSLRDILRKKTTTITEGRTTENDSELMQVIDAAVKGKNFALGGAGSVENLVSRILDPQHDSGTKSGSNMRVVSRPMIKIGG